MLILTDDYFYQTAIRFQEKEIGECVKSMGYTLVIRQFGIQELSEAGNEEIAEMIASTLSEGSVRLMLMSPTITALYDAIGFDHYDYVSAYARPIAVGMGDILSSSGKLDRIYRLENDLMFESEDAFRRLDGKKILLFNSSDWLSQAMAAKSFVPAQDQIDIKNANLQDIVKVLDNADNLYLLSYRLPEKIDISSLNAKNLVVPYHISIFFDGYSGWHAFCPDFSKMIVETIESWNLKDDISFIAGFAIGS